jgi:imidazolonepropionase-like amidohydrolase
VRLALARLSLTLALTLAATLAMTGCAAPERDLPSYAIVGATLMDGTARVPVDNSIVVVERGRISAMGPASEVEVPSDAKRVSGRGRFVFPRIFDQNLSVDGPADLILCDVNPARDPDYMKKTAGRMEKGRWTQFPN